jgi:putative membrane protein (TIGR04086 family)
MTWLRSLLAVLIGGLLSLLLTCAGEMTLPAMSSRARESAPSEISAQRRHDSQQGGGGVVAGNPSSSVSAVALEAAPTHVRVVALLIAGLVAGYVAARIAGRAAILHGALTVWPRVVMLLLFVSLGQGQSVDFSLLGYIVLGALCGAIGGWLYERQRPSPALDWSS